jgi:sodium/hydrogen antiporter
MPNLDPYMAMLLLGGLGLLGASLLPRLLSGLPLSWPIIYVFVGWAVVELVPQIASPDPFDHLEVIEHVTEFGVIISLMGAGLKIDRRIGWRLWQPTWRLLLITMPISIGLAALLGWWAVGFAPATALLLGAVLAPTDPVLASDVQVAPPGRSEERRDVRFALTSEAGLNDAMAFPFVNAAIAAALAGGVWVGAGDGPLPLSWVTEWLAVDVGYKLAVGLAGVVVVGVLVGRLAFGGSGRARLAAHSDGLVALSATLVAFGLTELLGGYGFLAVFVAACALRQRERDHQYHEILHDFAEQTERLFAVGIILAFGAVLAGGTWAVLTPAAGVVAVVLVLVVRPVAGYVGLLGTDMGRPERAAAAFFGIRGIGSMYYLAHALVEHPFPQAEELLAITALVIILSLCIHGASASPIMRRLDRRAAQAAEPVPGTPAEPPTGQSAEPTPGRA